MQVELDQLAVAFNLWMHRYTEDPEKFMREWKSVTEFLDESKEGKIPSYGQNCTAYLTSLLKELSTIS